MPPHHYHLETPEGSIRPQVWHLLASGAMPKVWVLNYASAQFEAAVHECPTPPRSLTVGRGTNKWLRNDKLY